MHGPRILVGTDGSSTANKALERAAELAVELKGTLTVVVVYEPGHGVEIAPLIARGGKTPEIMTAIQLYRRARGGDPEFHLLQGEAADSIVALSHDINADLVVIGSRGMGGVKDSLKGSIPTRVARSAPCDVYIVRTD